MLASARTTKVSQLFKAMGDPFRLRILTCLGDGEACVCHLERMLGKRQAYISQQLMAMRAIGILATRRDGKYVYYRLSDSRWLTMIRQAYEVAGLENGKGMEMAPASAEGCGCPQCGTN